jgi:hypothetical protein
VSGTESDTERDIALKAVRAAATVCHDVTADIDLGALEKTTAAR